MRNSTFNTDDDFRFNACVGNNGWVDHSTYSDGFDEAVTSLCQTVFNGGTADTLIYPIVFCARHRIELFIKSQLWIVGHIRAGISIPDERIIKTHNLQALWDLFVEMTKECDRRYADLVNKCTPTVMDFFAVDPAGETFRYPYSQDGVKHLTEQSIIGLQRFAQAYAVLTETMEDIEILSGLLYSEYSAGTYTKNLSRSDIEDIAKCLPNRDTWADPAGTFDFVRTSLLSKYKIGSREYSEALNLIQNHREFSSHVGLKNSVQHCNPSRLFETFKLRSALSQHSNSIQNALNPQYVKHRANFANYLNNEISNEELATLLALHELGSSHGSYSELYDSLYAKNLTDVQHNKPENIAYIIGKGMLEERAKFALRKMGQTQILAELTIMESSTTSQTSEIDDSTSGQ